MRHWISGISLVALMTAPALAQQAELPTPEQLWNLQMIGLPSALERGYTGNGFTIGIVDGTVQADHPEFLGRWQGGFNIFGGPYGPADTHGTHVAGTAAGANVGVARGASIVGVNIFGGADLDGQIGAGYRFGLDRGVRAFNNSWEFRIGFDTITTADVDRAFLETNHSGLLTAFTEVAEAGAIQVFATGNSGFSQPSWMAGLPYFYPEVQPYWLAVTSVGPDATRASYANACGVAAQWCLAAPGGDGPNGSDDAIWSAWPGSQYSSINGTSMASPAVTGALAIASEIFPGATGVELAQLLLQTATDIGAPGIDPVYGWGLLNLDNVVDTINPKTASTFANTSWARFNALGHASSAMRQRLSLPAGARVGTGSGNPQASYVSLTASTDGGALGVSDPAISGIWISPVYGHATINSGPTSRGARSQTMGGLIGVDLFSDTFSRFGIAGGYTQTRLSTRGATDSGKSDALHAGIYGSFEADGWFGQGSGLLAFFDQTVTRREISGADQTSRIPVGRSSFRGTALEADARFGYGFELAGGATLSPYAALTARWQQTDSFRESGAGIFNLAVPSNTMSQLAFGPGLRWSSAPIAMEGATLRLEADIAYARMTGDLRHKTNAALLRRPINGSTAELGRDTLRVSGRLNLTGDDEAASGFVGYDGAFQQRAVSHSVSAGLNFSF